MGWKSTTIVKRDDALNNIAYGYEKLSNEQLADVLEIVAEAGKTIDYDAGMNFIVEDDEQGG